jgi:hypothetical protein
MEPNTSVRTYISLLNGPVVSLNTSSITDLLLGLATLEIEDSAEEKREKAQAGSIWVNTN